MEAKINDLMACTSSPLTPWSNAGIAVQVNFYDDQTRSVGALGHFVSEAVWRRVSPTPESRLEIRSCSVLAKITSLTWPWSVHFGVVLEGKFANIFLGRHVLGWSERPSTELGLVGGGFLAAANYHFCQFFRVKNTGKG